MVRALAPAGERIKVIHPNSPFRPLDSVFGPGRVFLFCVSKKNPPPRLRDWRAKGVSHPSFLFLSAFLLSVFLLSVFVLSVFSLSVFTVGVYCRCLYCRYLLSVFTVGVFTVGVYCRLNVVKGTPPLPQRGADVCLFFFVTNFCIFFGIMFLLFFWIWVPFLAPCWLPFPSF